jgi:hypothetical protein
MAANTIEQLMERIARLETMTLLPDPRVPDDLTGRIWKLEDQLRSFGAAMGAGISDHVWSVEEIVGLLGAK